MASRSSGTVSSYGSFKPSLRDSTAIYRNHTLETQQDNENSSVSFIKALRAHGSRLSQIWSRKMRMIHSKGAILVLVWSFLVWGVLSTSWSEIRLPSSANKDSKTFAFKQSTPYLVTHYVIMLTVFLIGTPLSGWLADVYYGRYKVLQGSLLLLLCGLLLRDVVDLVYSYVPSTQDKTYSTEDVCLMIIHIFGSLLHWSGAVGFLSNAVQFGIDQMSDASTSEVSAFIFWYVFAMNMGIWTSRTIDSTLFACVRDDRDPRLTIDMILPVLCVSICLCSNFLLRKLLTAEPQTHNPFKLIYVVIKYAATHSKARVRSAFTYMDEPPSRLDLGKSKFGGPFTTEQVEDVKTFVRILLLMCPTSLIIIAISQVQFSLVPISEHLTGHPNMCESALITSFVYHHNLLISVFIVMYELVIYPFLRRRIITMLRRIGVGAFFLCLLTIILLTVDVVGHVDNHHIPCMFEKAKDDGHINRTLTDSIPLYSVEIPANILLALVLVLLTTATYEFVYAQSPYSMRGMLIGFAWCVYTLSFGVGELIIQLWKIEWQKHPIKNIPSCGLLFYSLSLLIALAGLLLFGLAACCYKNRVRDEVRNETAVIEEVYAKRCAMEYSIN